MNYKKDNTTKNMSSAATNAPGNTFAQDTNYFYAQKKVQSGYFGATTL